MLWLARRDGWLLASLSVIGRLHHALLFLPWTGIPVQDLPLLCGPDSGCPCGWSAYAGNASGLLQHARTQYVAQYGSCRAGSLCLVLAEDVRIATARTLVHARS